jgi:hypothetical protein
MMIFLQLSDQVLHRGKINAHSSLAGLQGERYGQVGFPLM